MLLPTEHRRALGELFTSMVGKLLKDPNPDGFAVAAAMAIVMIDEKAQIVAEVCGTLVQQIAAHGGSVEDLIAELQAMADAQGKGAAPDDSAG